MADSVNYVISDSDWDKNFDDVGILSQRAMLYIADLDTIRQSSINCSIGYYFRHWQTILS